MAWTSRRSGGAGACSSTQGQPPGYAAACGTSAMNIRCGHEPTPKVAAAATGGRRRGRIGVLIVNLGTPDATDAGSVRRYLREFLSDRRVIEDQGLVWKFVLNAIILPLRPRRKGTRLREDLEPRAQRIAAQDHHARAGRQARAALAARSTSGIVVDWAMRYGNPSLDSRLEALVQARLRAHPAGAALSAIRRGDHRDRLRRGLPRRSAGMRCQPALRVAPPYYDDPVYIEALAASIEAELQGAVVQARHDPRLVPRHPESLCRRRRSLSAPLRGDGAAAARAARPRRAAS